MAMKGVIFIISDIFYTILSGTTLTLISYVLSYIKERADAKSIKTENKEIKEKIAEVKEFTDGEKNIIDLMMKNVTELREYYVISKNQATRSFSSALSICFLGIVIYSIGIVSVVVFEADVTLITIIAGSIVELVSGLFFWLYVQASKQLGIYHQRLGSTEKYLTAIQIIKEMPKDRQADAYKNLIEAILIDNREIIKHESSQC